MIGPDLLNVSILKPGKSKLHRLKKKKKNFDHVIECTYPRGFITDGLFEFVAQQESHFMLHCAIRVKNHYLFQGGNFWQFTD